MFLEIKHTFMKTNPVTIDFQQLGPKFREYVREKAIKNNSTIVYRRGTQLVEENPKTLHIRVLEEHYPS
jgi:hypothetical protein